MTSEALYEQYKDALKRGHVASLRGRIDEALLAYAEAARIAPERSTPHASAGTALLRRRRPAEALRHYDVAISISPDDEAALLGRAHALAVLERRGEAADAFDALAEVQAGNGRLADAVDAARRGLELAEGRERRRTLARLIARLRSTEPDEPGRIALERALQVLDGLAVPPAMAAAPTDTVDEASAAGTNSEPALVDGAIEPHDEGHEAVDAVEVAALVPVDAIPVPPAPRELPPGATLAGLTDRAEAAVDAGLSQPAVDALLDLATLHARDGRIDAALDACYSAVSFDPDSVALHLALVELYLERGWDVLAVEKLDLLERLARLEEDDGAVADIAGVRAARA